MQYHLLILINVRWWNATAFYAVNIARILHRHGQRVTVACDPRYPAYHMARSLGLPVAPLAFGGFNPLRLALNWHRLLRLIKAEGIDIINSHRSEDHTFALLTKLVSAVRVVITRGDQRPIRPGLLSRLRYRAADAVIVTCRAIIHQNSAIFSGIVQRVHVIYGSIDEEHLASHSTSKEAMDLELPPTGALVVGMVGRISKTKDQYTFIRAAALIAHRHPQVTFLIAGDGVNDPRRGIGQLLASHGLKNRFRLIPCVEHIGEVIRRIDIGVITSVRSETISRVLLELFFFKKPVIATRINVIGEMIQAGVNGELFAPGDVRRLAALMDKLIQSSELRTRYGQNAHRCYQRKYTPAVFRRQYQAVLQRVMRPCRQGVG
jgi:glycosyltransferase involved in cell wall biosynthesis